MKFKVGDKIVPRGSKWVCPAADAMRADHAKVTMVIDGLYYYDLYKNDEYVGSCWDCQDDTNPKLMEKTMDNLQKGDVIADRDGDELIVIGVLGDIVFTTGYGNGWGSTLIFNTTELRKGGFTLKQPEPETTELTMDEVAEKFGVPVEQLKIKKGE